MTLRSRPANTWLKSLRVTTPSTTCDSTPSSPSLSWIVATASSCSAEPIGRGADATASSWVMARWAEKTPSGADAGRTSGVRM